MVKMELVPGFYNIYSKIFLKIMRKTDLQESTQKHDKNSFDVTITKCLWHTACVENQCSELCKLFCDVDDVTYDRNNLVVIYKKGKNNINELIDYLKSKKVNYNKIFVERPTLNDVFLELTGKDLRD